MPPVSQMTRERIVVEEADKIMATVQADAEELANMARAEGRAEALAAIDIEAIKAELRADLLGEIQAKQIDTARYSGPVAGTWEFWSTSKRHTPKIMLSDNTLLRFVDGRAMVTNETDAELIRRNFRGTVWESDWPKDSATQPPRCPETGFQPRSLGAWLAYQAWITPQMPIGR